MNANRISLLRWQLDVSWSLLELHLSELTDEECFWEPATFCWTVRKGPDGTWLADFEVPEPEPFPIPSIAWLTWHIGYWWLTTYDHAFGAGTIRREDVHWPGNAESAVSWLRERKDEWAGALEALDDSELDSTDRSGHFMRGTRPFGYVVAWVNAELMKNAAEIGLVRNLCALRS